MDSVQLNAWLTLQAVEGVGDRTILKLIQQWGSPAAVLAVSQTDLIRTGCSAELADRIKQEPEPTSRRQIERQISIAERRKIQVLNICDHDYPERLKTIPDPPPLLYVSGTLAKADEVAVAIVGGRRATACGLLITEEIARDLAGYGITVLSGLARGIDAAAHRGALAGKGRTIAVLGCGIDRTYPPEHAALRRTIEDHGAVISELPIGAPPQSHHFPRRNRILSGMSMGVLVTEAALKSGSLITAKLALEQGRDVFAVPGSVKEDACRGSNGLIKEGAKLVEGAQDILDEITPQLDARMRAGLSIRSASLSSDPIPLGAEEALIYHALSYEPQSVDTVIASTRLTPARVTSTLLALELNGRVRQLPGQQYIRI